ncbi:hypothetical protein EJ05DRAFT_478503 [Pseudovirgaria hyperparasitica]|uniref:Uncharacterized protein n=1 Tax=Pseudovirgaria hyperparasitica TaxID=470096 RepID=A0A6A6W037_9PEZI|nr:uncharacterized protein EJ05DRAFT_478503 [Pseudovirgaria hyperparasitica]KAF2755509.1 hypothetical protein EJ05DRAFT_478503 [Pseudovirgaria hyperparasitica]
MPPERQNNANPARPLMPTLASSRTARTPITPRLAAAAQPTTGGMRRNDRSDITSAPNTILPSSSVTPANKKSLNSNITPRSSDRRSRAGSTQSTSNDASIHSPPMASRPVSGFDGYRRDTGNSYTGSSLAAAAPVGGGRSRSVIGPGSAQAGKMRSRSPHSTLSGIAGSESGAREDQSMFFHADEARSQRAAVAPPVPSAPVQKKPTFFYADGRRETGFVEPVGVPSPPLSSLGRNNLSPPSQFFLASDAPVCKPSSIHPAASPPSALPEPNIQAPQSRALALRSPSPEKINIHLSYRKGASQIMRPNGHRPSPVSILSSEHLTRRRSSTDSPLAKSSHAKTSSLSSIDSINSPPRLHEGKVESTSPTTPLRANIAKNFTEKSTGRPSLDSNLSLPSESQVAMSEDHVSGPQSPTAPLQSGNSLQKMNELAANARRERKVLDLEISNSSLLAINRQLEREVRKQKAELRRYRRLSRAGRFSTSTARTSSGEYFDIDDSESLDILNEVDEDAEEDEDEEQSLSESSAEDEDLSPDALAERDARHAFKDEKRLQLDLSRHKELLVDSQKMNQSLKRCLGWTEELIAEGRKALEYKVKVSDVKLGGRVLQATEHENDYNDDDEENDPTIGSGGALLSPWIPSSEMQEDQINALLTSINAARTDRDSGIELELPQTRKDQLELS